MAADRLGACLVDDRRLRGARQQQLQAAVLIALLGDRLACRNAIGAGDGYPFGELLVGKVFEQVDGAQLLHGHRRL